MADRVAVIGLGLMGREIARRLEAAGFGLVVYNRSAEPRQEFAERGATLAVTPAEAGALAPIVVTMLSDGAAVEAVTMGKGGLFSAAGEEERTLIEMSTIGPEESRRIAAAAEGARVDYLCAPVSGNPSVVAAGKLTILLSGPAAAIERARPVLEAIGPKLIELGDDEQARVMKLALNLILGGLTELLAEATVMAEANGLERETLLRAMNESVIASPYLAYKTEALIERDYSTTFTISNLRKDLNLMLDTAGREGVPLPVTELVERLAADSEEKGLGDLDLLALAHRLELEAGRVEPD